MSKTTLASGKIAEYVTSKVCLTCFNLNRRISKDKDGENQRLREWRAKNHSEVLKKENQYYTKHSDRINQRRRKRYASNASLRRKSVERVTNFRNNNIYYKINHTISTAVRACIKDKSRSQVFALLGYSLEDLMNHIESKFQDGMSWSNHGSWHIDHIKPVCSFSFSSKYSPEFKKCWSLDNLRPLWAIDNLKKSHFDKSLSIRHLRGATRVTR
jgi:hypothetical protein